MAFMFVGTDDAGIDGDMVGHDGIGHDAFVESEVFGRMTGVDGGETSLKLLPIATGVDPSADVVLMKDGELCRGVADAIVGLTQRLHAQEVIGSRG